MGAPFPHSKDLLEIIEQHSWQLYDATVPDGRETALTFNELQRSGPATTLENERNYLFVPRPTKNQSLRDAYAVTKGLGPAIKVMSKEDHHDMDGAGAMFQNNGLLYLFTRLFIGYPVVGMTTLRSLLMPQPPQLIIPYRSVVDKFSKLFRIVTPEEMNVSRQDLAAPEWWNQNSRSN